MNDKQFVKLIGFLFVLELVACQSLAEKCLLSTSYLHRLPAAQRIHGSKRCSRHTQ